MQAEEFRLGDWKVRPAAGLLVDAEGVEKRLQPKVMAVLAVLAEAGGNVVSRQELVDRAWEGRPTSDEPINRCIAELRAALGDDSTNPAYIETYPKRGYRLLMAPQPLDSTTRSTSSGGWFALAGLLLLSLSVLMTDQGWRPLRASGQPRLLVTPVISMVDGEEAALLAAAMTDAFTLTLSRHADMTVLSSRGDPEGTEAIGLDIDFRLETHLGRHGENWQFTFQLVDARNHERTFSETYSEADFSLDALPGMLARQLRRALELEQTVPGEEMLDSTLDREDFRDFIEAQYLYRSGSETAARQALIRLDRVIEHRPDLADAYAHRAAAQFALMMVRSANRPVYRPLITADVDRALQLDPGQPLARALNANRMAGKEPLRAMQEYAAILADAPEQAEARRWYAQLLYRHGYLTESLDHFHYLYERDPLSPLTVAWLADVSLATNDLDGFDKLYRTAVPRKIEFSSTSLFLRAIVSGDREAATAYLQQRWAHSSRVTPEELAVVVDGIFDTSLRPTSVELVTGMLTRPKPITRWWGFVFYALLGEHDLALGLYDGIELSDLDRRIQYQVWSIVHQDFRASPVFLEFMQRFGIDTVWRERGPGFRCESIAGGALDCSASRSRVVTP